LRRLLFILLFLIISISAFANLGVSYGEIMSGGFDNYFNMQYRPLNDGTPRYIGEYGVIGLEIIGNKNAPENTSFYFTLVNDLKTLTGISNTMQNWMRNTMVYSSNSAYNWVIDVWERISNRTSYETSKSFSSYVVTVIWKGGIMLINIKRPGYAKKSTTQKNTNNYSEETANVRPAKHTVHVKSVPSKGGKVAFAKTDWKVISNNQVSHGSYVYLYAKPNKEYCFKGWYYGNNLITEDNPYAKKITRVENLEARFSHLKKVEVLNNSCKTNEKIQIEIRGEDISSISAMDLYIVYDEKYLKPTENRFVSLGEELKDYRIFVVDKMHPGKIKISIGKIDGNLSSVKSSKIITINMVSKDIPGKTTLNIAKNSQIIGSDYREMDVVFNSGTLLIKE